MERRALFLGIVGAATTAAATVGEWKNRFAEQFRDEFLAHWLVEKQAEHPLVLAAPGNGSGMDATTLRFGGKLTI